MFWNIKYLIIKDKIVADPDGIELQKLEEYILFEIRDYELKQKLFNQIEDIRNMDLPELD